MWTVEEREGRFAVFNDAGVTDSAHWNTAAAAAARAGALNVTDAVLADAPARGATFYAVLAIDDWMTEDGRYIETFDWATPPLPLMALDESQMGGHMGAELAGRIETIEKLSDGRRVFATGTFDPTDAGVETEMQVRGQSLRFISVDPAAVDVEEEITKVDGEGWPIEGILRFTSYTIGGATACPFPAIRMAVIWCDGMDAPTELSSPLPIPVPPVTVPEVDGVEEGDIIVVRAASYPANERPIFVEDGEQRALLAGAAAACALTDDCGGPTLPPAEWFENPRLDGPARGTVLRSGQIYGHLALWNTPHRGYLNYEGGDIYAPRSSNGYAGFLTKSTPVACCSDAGCGHELRTVATGVLTLGTTHASKNASVANVLAHYENTGLCAADIVIGEDAYGIWYAGALRPGMSDDRVREFLGSGPSGDWRGRGGTLDLVAVLMVNSEGFPIIASSYIEGDETVVFFSGWFGPEVDDVEEDAIVASLGGGHTPAPEPDFRKLLRSEIRALRALIDERVAPIERDLDLLRPLAAEALAARIDDVLVYDDASTR